MWAVAALDSGEDTVHLMPQDTAQSAVWPTGRGWGMKAPGHQAAPPRPHVPLGGAAPAFPGCEWSACGKEHLGQPRAPPQHSGPSTRQ